MFRCQYCGSHVSWNEKKMIWVDIMKSNNCPYLKMADGTYKHAPHQDAVFYVQSDSHELVMKIGEIPIIRHGHLRFWLPEKQIALRTTDALVKAGIYHDDKLEFYRRKNTWEELEVPEFQVLSFQGMTSFTKFDAAIAWASRLNTLDGATFKI